MNIFKKRLALFLLVSLTVSQAQAISFDSIPSSIAQSCMQKATGLIENGNPILFSAGMSLSCYTATCLFLISHRGTPSNRPQNNIDVPFILAFGLGTLFFGAETIKIIYNA